MRFIRVLLPEPEAPTRERNSPARTVGARAAVPSAAPPSAPSTHIAYTATNRRSRCLASAADELGSGDLDVRRLVEDPGAAGRRGVDDDPRSRLARGLGPRLPLEDL